MRTFVIPIISLAMSVLYYTPWIFGATRANLAPYILAFFWFLGVWIVGIAYGVKAYGLRKTDPTSMNRYLIALGIVLFSYVIVGVGVFSGYMITV